VSQFVAFVGPKIKEIADFIQKDVMPVVKAEFAKFQVYYASDIKPAIDNIVAAVKKVVETFKEHWGQIEPFVRPIFIAIETYVKTLQNTIKIILDLIQGDWEGAWNGIKDQARLIFDAINRVGERLQRPGARHLHRAARPNHGRRLVAGGFGHHHLGYARYHGHGGNDHRCRLRHRREDGDKLNPKNWIGSPKGIQNWFPYYMAQGLANMASVAKATRTWRVPPTRSPAASPGRRTRWRAVAATPPRATLTIPPCPIT